MNQPNICPRSSVQLGNQICSLMLRVGATIVLLFVSVCLWSWADGRKVENTWRSIVCARGERRVLQPQPSSGEPVRRHEATQDQPRARAHALRSALFISNLFANLNLQRRCCLCPRWTGCLRGPLISLKWQSVNMHKKGAQLAFRRLTGARFRW